MTFRITPHRQLELQRLHAQSHASRSATLQNQISSGVRVHRPSDDPIAQQTILSQQRVLNRLEVQHNAIQHARASLTQSNEQLLDANQLVVQAKTLALQGRQSQTSFELQSLADEVNGFLETLETVANAKFDGKYLFSGTSTTQEPYSGIVDGPTQYQGSPSTGVVVLSGDDDLDVYLAGDEAFQFVDPESNELTDIFSVVRQIRDDLQSAADGNLEEAGTRLDSTIESLEVASEHLLSVVGRQAVVLQQLDRVEERTEDLQFQAESILSDLQSTDVASAVVALQEEQNLLQFTFATTTRLLETSLLNFLG